MKAAVYYENGTPEVFKYEDVSDPVCHPKGVVIRVEAVSIEGGDTLNRWRGPLLAKPHIVGYQAGGEIIEVGSEVTGLKVGQKVATSNAFGSHAELRAVPARNAWVVPDGFDVKLASVIPVAFAATFLTFVPPVSHHRWSDPLADLTSTSDILRSPTPWVPEVSRNA